MGDIVLKAGRDINAADCQDVDVLLVRSVTKVNAELLTHSRVKFVGTCTIGIDHLDTDFLDQQGITWASAPGCNANAVVQYVLSVMSHLQADWLDKRVGIIGCGNIGAALHRYLNAFRC